MFFWRLNLVRLRSLDKILYPKRRIESYAIMGTIVSPNKILLVCISAAALHSMPGLREGKAEMHRVVAVQAPEVQPARA